MLLKDLPKNPRNNVCLYCPDCTSTYSADRGDYILRGEEEAVCEGCETVLVLVQKRSMLEPISPERAEQKKRDEEEEEDDDDGE